MRRAFSNINLHQSRKPAVCSRRDTGFRISLCGFWWVTVSRFSAICTCNDCRRSRSSKCIWWRSCRTGKGISSNLSDRVAYCCNISVNRTDEMDWMKYSVGWEGLHNRWLASSCVWEFKIHRKVDSETMQVYVESNKSINMMEFPSGKTKDFRITQLRRGDRADFIR